MIKRFTLVALLSASIFGLKAQGSAELTHLASYETGIADAAEVVAYDKGSKRAFFTSHGPNILTILNLSNPASPVKVTEVDLSTYGAGPNSVAVYNGIVAVSVEAAVKTDAGKVVFFDTDGVFISKYTVGSLPDMVTFTPDGNKLIVANEGEPNDDYSVDPEGSVSIIDLTSGAATASVSHIMFTDWNNRKISLQNKGVRIFGNNGASSVAQDLEPEYIAVTEDGMKAYVNCQENNALVLVDLTNNSILDILPLGYKDYNSGKPMIEDYVINELVASWPSLGAPVYDGGQAEVKLGGFSGLHFSGAESNATDYVFYAIPDRGPNGDAVSKSSVTPAATQNLRPFKLPNYQARMVKFTLNINSGAVTLDNQIMLTRKDGTTPISGKGNVPGVDEVPVTYTDAATSFANSDYVDGSNEEYHELSFDEFGGDFEGILMDKHGNFWMCDEYRPSVYKFESNGKLIERYVPAGTAAMGTNPQSAGTYGAETLPAIYSKRWANRGFEAIAYDSSANVIYAFIQSPLLNTSKAKDNSDVIRILGIDAANGTPVSEYVYLLERNKFSGYSASRADKIGDAVYTGNGRFLVVERDSEGPTNSFGKKMVFEVDLLGATNILNLPISSDTLELMTADELMLNNVQTVHKTLKVNLPSIGYQSSDKVEGIALLPEGKMALINDNDFGLAGAGITDKTVLSILSFDDSNKLDPSDKDAGFNQRNIPVLGMYLPDGIATYEVNGINYIVTANEGDSRDYSGYSEETRVKDLTLNANNYPDAATIQQQAEVGRLKTTLATGDYNNDQVIDQIYAYGGRSFSIFDQYGNLVFDSNNQLELKASTEEPDLINEDEGEKEGRSDDKGIEPEAVGLGKIGANTYAFIGAERQSAIYVYDITDPKAPIFVDYYTNRSYDPTTTGDISPEIIKFVSSDDSPNGNNLLIVGYEVSGSVGIIQVGADLTSVSEQARLADFNLFPNPATNNVNFSKNVSGVVVDMNGAVVLTFNETNSIDIQNLSQGVYSVVSNNGGMKRFVKTK